MLSLFGELVLLPGCCSCGAQRITESIGDVRGEGEAGSNILPHYQTQICPPISTHQILTTTNKPDEKKTKKELEKWTQGRAYRAIRFRRGVANKSYLSLAKMVEVTKLHFLLH